jgi:hypothetical protein
MHAGERSVGSLLSLLACTALAGAAALLVLVTAAAATPFGTSYTASVVNLPGTDTAVLAFDGLDEALGSSGLVVGENSTTFVGFEMVEFSLRTADGNPFVGQQVSPLEMASVLATDLQYFGDPSLLEARANSPSRAPASVTARMTTRSRSSRSPPSRTTAIPSPAGQATRTASMAW